MSRIPGAVVLLTMIFGVAGSTSAQDRARADARPTKNPLEGNAFAIGNGRAMFRNRCAGCHGPDARGYLGPDLSRIGSARPRAGLLAKVRGTTAIIRPGYEAVTLVTRSGDRIRGVRKNEDEFSVQIMDTRERLQGYLKANLAEYTTDKQSLMPVYGPDRLGDKDVDDLLRYLTSLRGTQATRSSSQHE